MKSYIFLSFLIAGLITCYAIKISFYYPWTDSTIISTLFAFIAMGIVFSVAAKISPTVYEQQIDHWITHKTEKHNFVPNPTSTSFLNGVWTGHYTYTNSTEEEALGKQGFFEITLTELNTIIIGKCKETSGYMIGEPVFSKITGLREVDFIRFHKTYKDANYVGVPPSSHQVDYEGVYDHDLQLFKGTWALNTSEQKNSSDTYDGFFISGTWEMSKI